MFKSITHLNLCSSLNFTSNASVILLGQIISKAPKLSFIDFGRQAKHLIEICYPAETSQDLRLKSRAYYNETDYDFEDLIWAENNPILIR